MYLLHSIMVGEGAADHWALPMWPAGTDGCVACWEVLGVYVFKACVQEDSNRG